MEYHEVVRFLLPWLEVVPIAQAQDAITLTLNGTALLVILLAIGAYWGYQFGFRNLLTVAFWTIAAYIATVQGGNFVVQLINRMWQNGPRLLAIVLGRDTAGADVLEPLITTELQVPLFFRFVAFVALVLLGFFFSKNSSWNGPPNEPLAKPLGLFVGALVVALWSNAMKIFWIDFQNNGGNLGGPVANVLNTLPNIADLTTSLIVIFFIIILGLVFFYFPKVWQAGGRK
ncbi:hypothetical protein [Candidatus Viridilinea mediisalina]|uniref:Uncharacterized protein n=1 Tax=Candidatus Viridilinea mediisalina TaxID=2024553 RepID=A0A2A6RPR7_9CHLR|nr:hypothetical protein [Candidatus Viridilinea mediisalina]PDW04891.1 hypothetical protein CJ255_01420 [Candidatus Viridilinea mediisalina]